MSRDTFANSIIELFGLLASDATGTPRSTLVTAGVINVYDHEPRAGDVLRACVVTVAPGGMTPEYWLINQRVYSYWAEGAKPAQDKCLAAMIAVDELMTDGFGPSTWDFRAVDELDAFVASNLLTVPRDDLSS